MDRGSDKVPPREDEELKQDAEAFERGQPETYRVEEHREVEEPPARHERPEGEEDAEPTAPPD